MDEDSHLCRNRNIPSVVRDRAKRLRRTQTPAEALLWRLLQQHQSRVKFRRQHAIGHLILDFYCASLRLGIEIDGPIHRRRDVYRKDVYKDEFLTGQGITLLRCRNEEIIDHPVQVIERILLAVERIRNQI